MKTTTAECPSTIGFATLPERTPRRLRRALRGSVWWLPAGTNYDGIYELRARHGRVNYRILYSLHGQDVALLVHALTKEKRVPDADIARAIRRKERYEQDPKNHRAQFEVPEDL